MMTPVDPLFLLIPILHAAQPVSLPGFMNKLLMLCPLRQTEQSEISDQHMTFLKTQHQDFPKNQRHLLSEART